MHQASRKRNAAALVLLPLSGVVMMSCSPETSFVGSPADPADVGVSVAIDADGDARMRFDLERFDPMTSPTLIRDVAREAFPRAAWIEIDPDSSYSRSIAVEVEEAFDGGISDGFTFDGGALTDLLESRNYETVDLDVCWPDVTSTVESPTPLLALNGCLTWWGMSSSSAVPLFTVRFEPDPWRWWVAFVLGLAGAATAATSVVALRRRPPARAIAFGSAAVAFLLGGYALGVGGPEGAQAHLELTGLGDVASTVTRIMAGISITGASGAVVVALITGTIAVGGGIAQRQRLRPPPRPDHVPDLPS